MRVAVRVGRSSGPLAAARELCSPELAACAHKAAVLFRYLRRLNAPRIILWCYAIWYLVVLVRYFDPSLELWLTSLGLGGIVGIALLLSTRAAMGGGRIGGWGLFRLLLMPVCVSSFAALVKGRGFVLIFSPRLDDTLLAVALCAAFLTVVAVAKRIGR